MFTIKRHKLEYIGHVMYNKNDYLLHFIIQERKLENAQRQRENFMAYRSP